MTQETERVMLSIPLENVDELLGLFGVFDENIGVLEDETGAQCMKKGQPWRLPLSNPQAERGCRAPVSPVQAAAAALSSSGVT